MEKYILGIDEVGRGSVAGPVVLAGVCLRADKFPLLCSHFEKNRSVAYENLLSKVRDSKKLNPKFREEISTYILSQNLNYFILSADNKLIDIYGIGVCLSHLLMLGCLILDSKLSGSVSEKIDCKVLIDGKIKLLKDYNLSLIQDIITQNSILLEYKILDITNFFQNRFFNLDLNRENKADDKYLSVALASNLAKVWRDQLMSKLGDTYPEFNWATNKGYGTAKHLNTIIKNPDNPLLRTSFLSKYLDRI